MNERILLCMGNIFKSLRVVVSIIILTPVIVLAENLPTNLPTVVITSVKIGGIVENEPTEFAELYNNTNETISLAGWRLEYAKPIAKITDCSNGSWGSQDSTSNIKELLLTGEIGAKQFMKFVMPMNDNAGGSLRLTSPTATLDTIGWGNSVSLGICSEAQLASIPANGKSIDRVISLDGYAVDTNNNFDDFILSDQNQVKTEQPVNDRSDDSKAINICEANLPQASSLNSQNCTELPQLNQPICYSLEISEIVPNPAGTDTDKEYVELFNSSSELINLSGCQIKINGSAKQLSGTALPGYNAYYGLTLPNASGATVELVTNTTEDVVTYPGDLKDDQAWVLFAGKWQISDQPTPSLANEVIIKSTIEAKNESVVQLEPCVEGKYRNPETNRCKNIEAEDETQKDCKEGQERNLATNRCKQVSAILASSLKACSAGQERNPETNRCRKIAVATSVLTACKAGQERNPATNRCRKVAGITTSANSSTKSNNGLEQELKSKQNISYGVFVAMAVLVVGYGIFEYRDNISNLFLKLKAKSTS